MGARIAVPHGEIPRFMDLVIDHVIQKTHSAVSHYNGGLYDLSVTEMSFAVEECAKLNVLGLRHGNGEGITHDDLEKMRSHVSKISSYRGRTMPAGGRVATWPPGTKNPRGPLHGFAAFREFANYIEYRPRLVLSALGIFGSQETMRQFAYCAIYWAVGAMRPTLVGHRTHGVSVLFPFCRAGSPILLPKIEAIFAALDSLREDIRKPTNTKAAESMRRLETRLGGADLRESFSAVHRELTASSGDSSTSVLGAVPHLVEDRRLPAWMLLSEREKLVIVFVKSSVACRAGPHAEGQYCEACRAYIGSREDTAMINARQGRPGSP